MNRTTFAILAGSLLAMACGEPAHLQRTYGQAYTEAFTQQVDLDRPAAQDAQYALTGEEGLALRQRVAEATSDAEEGASVED